MRAKTATKALQSLTKSNHLTLNFAQGNAGSGNGNAKLCAARTALSFKCQTALKCGGIVPKWTSTQTAASSVLDISQLIENERLYPASEQMTTKPNGEPDALGCDDLLGTLVSRWGFESIPWREMRSCPCRKCGKKMLMYANHAHAFGWKDHSRIACRGCHARFKLSSPNSQDHG